MLFRSCCFIQYQIADTKKPTARSASSTTVYQRGAIMNTITTSSNTGPGATHFAQIENVALPVTMSSREIADLVSSRHDSVKRTIERLAEKGFIGTPPVVEYLDGLGRPAIQYQVGKRDSFVVVAQLSPSFTATLVDRWQELEEQVARPFQIPATYAEALQIAADQRSEEHTSELQSQ